MNLYKFDSSKITWSGVNIGVNNFKVSGTNIRVTNNEYFKEFIEILKTLVNTKFKLFLVDNIRKESYTIDCIKLINFDLINQVFKDTPTKDNTFIECVIREDAARFTSTTIVNYSLYLAYE